VRRYAERQAAGRCARRRRRFGSQFSTFEESGGAGPTSSPAASSRDLCQRSVALICRGVITPFEKCRAPGTGGAGRRCGRYSVRRCGALGYSALHGPAVCFRTRRGQRLPCFALKVLLPTGARKGKNEVVCSVYECIHVPLIVESPPRGDMAQRVPLFFLAPPVIQRRHGRRRSQVERREILE